MAEDPAFHLSKKDGKMSERKLRILMAKLGEGSEQSMFRLARSFSEAGYEVIYTSTQNPRAISISALQESADHIGITTLPGSRLEQFKELIREFQQQGVGHIPVSAGGIFPEEDLDALQELGIVKFFKEGTTYQELLTWSRKNIKPLDLD